MSCTCRKLIFISRQEAVLSARSSAGQGRPLYPYVCPGDPALWHLSSHRKRRGRPRGERR